MSYTFFKDHLSSTNLMCAILLLFYASGTVKGAAFGDSCSSDSECTDAHNACNTTCGCSNEAFRNNAGSACVLKVALNATCVSGELATQCVDSLAECRDDGGLKCLCKVANYRSDSVCKVKVALNATCVSEEPATQCVDSLAECRDDSGLKCLCKAANYNSGSACKVKIALDATCASGEPTTQCVDLAECKDEGGLKCVCKDGNYKSGSACKVSSDAAIIIAHMYVFIFGIVASLYFLV